MKLERIVPGCRLSGIAGGGAVEVVATRSYGPDAVEVTWKGPDGLGERILYREDEPRIGEVSPGRRWAFDGDGDAFRLASEALRIRLAHLFDPYAAVNASHIEPLPHQLTAVYGAMLDRQPLRFLLADDPGTGKSSGTLGTPSTTRPLGWGSTLRGRSTTSGRSHVSSTGRSPIRSSCLSIA